MQTSDTLFCEHPVKTVDKSATAQSTVSQQQPMSQKSGVKSQEQPFAGTTGGAVGVGGVSGEPPGVSVSRVVASGELRLTVSMIATVASADAAPPGGGVVGVKAPPFVVLTLLVEFKLGSVAAFVELRHKKIHI